MSNYASPSSFLPPVLFLSSLILECNLQFRLWIKTSNNWEPWEGWGLKDFWLQTTLVLFPFPHKHLFVFVTFCPFYLWFFLQFGASYQLRPTAIYVSRAPSMYQEYHLFQNGTFFFVVFKYQLSNNLIYVVFPAPCTS